MRSTRSSAKISRAIPVDSNMGAGIPVAAEIGSLATGSRATGTGAGASDEPEGAGFESLATVGLLEGYGGGGLSKEQYVILLEEMRGNAA